MFYTSVCYSFITCGYNVTVVTCDLYFEKVLPRLHVKTCIKMQVLLQKLSNCIIVWKVADFKVVFFVVNNYRDCAVQSLNSQNHFTMCFIRVCLFRTHPILADAKANAPESNKQQLDASYVIMFVTQSFIWISISHKCETRGFYHH